jgi:rubrerythrin
MEDTSSTPLVEMSFLDACIKIEETCASIYYSFAGIFADSPKIYSLWTEMAIEEEKHADEFRSIKAIHCSNYNSLDTENELIEEMLEQVELVNDNLNKKTPTLYEALTMAVILEKSVEKYHLEASKQILDPELARMLFVMVEYSHGHVETLRLAADSIDLSD